jgi:hypothetical protein
MFHILAVDQAKGGRQGGPCGMTVRWLPPRSPRPDPRPSDVAEAENRKPQEQLEPIRFRVALAGFLDNAGHPAPPLGWGRMPCFHLFEHR